MLREAEEKKDGRKWLMPAMGLVAVLILICLYLFFSGSAAGESQVLVEGLVYYQGEPLDKAFITFYSKDPEVTAEIREGRYKTRMTPGTKLIKLNKSIVNASGETVEVIPPPSPMIYWRTNTQDFVFEVAGKKQTINLNVKEYNPAAGLGDPPGTPDPWDEEKQAQVKATP